MAHDVYRFQHMGQKRMKFNKLGLVLSLSIFSGAAFAQDISGIWQQIDDKSGAPKAVIQIRKEANNTFTGKIIKITPRPGYTPRAQCNKCPAPYTNQPILGMDILKGLVPVKNSNNYEKGQIIDPLAGKIYSARVKMNPTGSRITVKAYIGVSTLGRSQTWIRQN